jgi:parafibromin
LTKETPTRYTSKADSKDDFYTVGQIWLAWTEKDAGVRDYLMKGQAGGIGYVGIADRRGVVEYLQGESDGGSRIASNIKLEGKLMETLEVGAKLTRLAPVETATSATVEALPGALETTAEAGPSKPAAPAKRRYEVDQADLEFCKRVRHLELEGWSSS